ncbi:MAG: hypothetical protein BWZ10_00962 [candidate division BRC1 bacterium ADurb.BinA364]|nr:MAG: hypothetical protein BWZ10_00962 [candidate division BRC1 bacterium ADurb.BinA364]
MVGRIYAFGLDRHRSPPSRRLAGASIAGRARLALLRRRHRLARESLSLRRRSPRQPEARIGRAVFRPLRRNNAPAGGTAARSRHPGRRIASRHARRHAGQPGAVEGQFPFSDPRTRRKRHQIIQPSIQFRSRAPGRKSAQNDPGHGPGRARDSDQAVRPAAQHAHAGLAARIAPAQNRPGHSRRFRAAGQPHRHEPHSSRPRRLRDVLSVSGGLRLHALARRAEKGGSRIDRPAFDRGPERASARRRAESGNFGAPQAFLQHLPEDAGAAPDVRRDLRSDRDPHHRRHGVRLLRNRRRGSCAVASRSRPIQGLHRAAEGQRLPVHPYHRDRAGRRGHRNSNPHARNAPDGRGRHRRALALQGRDEGAGRPGGQTDLAAAGGRLAAGCARSQRIHGGAEAGRFFRRRLLLHAQGRCRRIARRIDRAGFRLLHPHRNRPSMRRGADQPQNRSDPHRNPDGRCRGNPAFAHGPPDSRLAQGRQNGPRALENPPLA